MAVNKKISGLVAAGALTGAELVPVVQGGTTVKTTAQDIANLLALGTAVIGPGTTNITKAAHLGRALSCNEAGATSVVFAAHAVSGALDGDGYECLITGAGTQTASGAVYAAAGKKLTASTGETLTFIYDSTLDQFYSTTEDPSAVGAGTVTHTAGALTASALMVGNGSADSKVLASLGTTTTVLHGNAAGLPTFGAVSLTADVTGVLPVANYATGTPTGSKFVRDDGVLAVPGGSVAGSTKQVQYNNAGAFGAEAGFEYDASTNVLSVEKVNVGSSTTFNANSISGDDQHYLNVTNDPAVEAGLSGFGLQLLRINSYDVNGWGGNVHFCRYRGSEASPTAVQSGDTFMSFGMRGFQSSGGLGQSSGSFSYVATENHTSGAHGGEWRWGTTANGSTTRVDTLHLGSYGLALQVGAFNGAPRTTIASATTCDVFSKLSNAVTISGTTTITSLSSTGTDGMTRDCTASGAFILTHNATSLILPTGANITTAAGDTFTVENLGSNNVRITNYMRASGAALAASGGGGDALVANPLSQFAATTSAQLAGVISDETGSGALVFATSPTLVTPILGTPTSGTLTNCTGLPTAGLVANAVTNAKAAQMANSTIKGRTTAGTGDPEDLTALQAAAILQGDGLTSLQAGFRNIPQNSQSAAYTTVAADSGKHILHPSGDANARTFTIDSNANVAYPVGTAITFVNQTSQVVSIAITSDTLTLAGSTTSGTRSLAQNGVATALKITSTIWLISGTGLT